MATTELIVTQITCVPDIISSLLQIGSAFHHRMLVIAIETGFVDQIDDSLFGIGDSKGGVCGADSTIRVYLEYRTEMDGLHWITCSVSCHGELVVAAFHLMRHLCRHHNLAVDISFESDGNEFVRVRSEILSCEGLAIAHETIVDEGAVEIQFSTIFTDVSFILVDDIQGA